MRVSYVSLGCAKNQVDFEYLIGELSSYGFEAECDPSKCDAVIINTCGFIEPAVKEAVDNILLMSKTIPAGAKLIVTGCMAERYKDDIKNEIPEIDFVTGVGKLSEVCDYLLEVSGGKKSKKPYERVIVNSPYYAFLKISEGCDNRCSYCTIPSIRGALKSRPQNEIIDEAQALINKGVKELIIISQDTTKYAKDFGGTSQIVPLLDELSSKFPDTFFRILYLNPDGVTDELIELIAARKNIIKYFEIPVQHASDNVLKAMKRRSNSKQISDIFDKIRAKIPEAFIRTTFIIGFPSETDEDFETVKKFIEEKRPDFAGFFPYYQEDGTEAATLENINSKKITQARIKKLQSVQKRNTLERLKKMKKQSFLCFIENANEDFEFILEGRAIFQAPEIDGKLYVTDGVASHGVGIYEAVINKLVYPDIYVTLKEK